MKRNIVIVLLMAIGLASCSKSNQFNVNVSLKNADDNTMIYLRKIVDNKTVVIDSVLFQNEVATLTAPKDETKLLYSIKVKGMRGSMLFFPENQDVTVVGAIDNPTDVEILGGEAQALYNEYNKGFNAFNLQLRDLYSKMEDAYNNNDSVLMESISQQGNEIMKQQGDYTENFIQEHKDHFVGHYVLDEKKQDYTLEELKEAVAGFTTDDLYTKDLNDYIAKLENLAIGKPFIDFTLQTVEGEDVTLSEYIKGNKLTLVDFWASWCGPCRAENPVVLAAYNRYHEKGFEVLGVSIDQDATAWQNAVNADQLPWTHVRDAEAKVSEDYLIYYIPSNLLLDENGIIVEKNLRGEKLEEALSSRL
ncbi:MAG: AhpC/TSA family protein [Bacteroidales bacterium]|nr:AhpC/TSA family protein [Bacteroidales bacterium]